MLQKRTTKARKGVTVPYIDVLLVAVLITINAGFAGSEIALISLRESQVRRLEERGGAGNAIARLVENPNRFLSTIQVGITLAGFLASATAAVSLAEPLAHTLPITGSLAGPVAVVLVTLGLTFLTLVFGELAPKRLAMQRTERWSLLAARPLVLMAGIAAPAVALLGAATDLVLRVLGADPHQARQPVTEEELRDMIASQVTLTPFERQIVSGALDIGERTLAQLLRPRADVFSVATEEPASVALAGLLSAGYSRAPVAEGGDLDRLTGIVHLRDLLGASGTAGEASHPPMVLAETLPALDALRRLQQQHEQMAVVLDEHQAVAGIVTIEDLVEEIVGEIYDESDSDIVTVRRVGRQQFVVPGSFPVHDLEDLGVDVPKGPYTTVAGLVIEQLSGLPENTGAAVTVAGWRFQVVGLGRRRISWVRVTRAGD